MLLALSIAGLLLLPPPWNVVAVLAGAVLEVGELWLWRRYLGRHGVWVGAEAILGARAEVIEACDPDGRVRLRGEIWNARARARVESGEEVTVTAVDGLVLEVAPPAGR